MLRLCIGQVYRHLLFNELGRDVDIEEKFDVSNPPPPPPTLSPPPTSALSPGHFQDPEPLSESKIIRFGTLLLLFDVYLTWARIEKATSSSAIASRSPLVSSSSATSDHNGTAVNGMGPALGAVEGSYLATQPILLQYLFFLVLCALEVCCLLSCDSSAFIQMILRCPNNATDAILLTHIV